MIKTNPTLGHRVHRHLLDLGLETPMIKNNFTDEEKINKIEEYYLEIMKILGLDYTNDSMIDTPTRVAKLMVNESMYGLDYNKFPKIMVFENSFHDAGMVVEKGIRVNSLCSHHLVPTIGYTTIGYIPEKKILGLSKLNRIVDFFSRRPQEQERMVGQIHAAVKFLLETEHVAVHIRAKHYCVSWRGVKDEDSEFITSKLSGSFLDQPMVRQEFYDIAKG